MFASPYDLCATATFVTLTVPNIIIPAVAVIIKKALGEHRPRIHTYCDHPSRLRCFSLRQAIRGWSLSLLVSSERQVPARCWFIIPTIIHADIHT